MEIWKNIKNYEGLYQVSNLGNVKSLKFGKERIMKFGYSRGYFYVPLWNNGNRKTLLVHRLVYQTFKGELIEGLVIDHISGIPTQNNVENLQQIDQRQNVVKGEVTKNKSSKHIGVGWQQHANKWKASISMNNKTKHLGYFETEEEAAEAYQKELSKINFLSPQL